MISSSSRSNRINILTKINSRLVSVIKNYKKINFNSNLMKNKIRNNKDCISFLINIFQLEGIILITVINLFKLLMCRLLFGHYNRIFINIALSEIHFVMAQLPT